RLSVDSPRREDPDGALAVLGAALVRESIHRMAEFLAGADHPRHAIGQRHRQRTTDTLASVAVHNHAPGAGAHPIGTVHDAALKPNAEVGVGGLARPLRARPCAGYRLVVTEGLVRYTAGDDLRRHPRLGEIRGTHGRGRGHLHRVARPHGYAANRRHAPNLGDSEYLRPVPTRAPVPAPVFIAGRLWLDFVNTDDARLGQRVDVIPSFSALVDWLVAALVVDAERATVLRRRSVEQPSGAAAALIEAQRIRTLLRQLTEHARHSATAPSLDGIIEEVNRVLS